jgi:hypothetical protein
MMFGVTITGQENQNYSELRQYPAEQCPDWFKSKQLVAVKCHVPLSILFGQRSKDTSRPLVSGKNPFSSRKEYHQARRVIVILCCEFCSKIYEIFTAQTNVLDNITASKTEDCA